MVRFGGYQNPRSGATPTKKNDGRTSRNLGNELIEFKRTDNKRSITVNLVDLLDVEVHALAQSRSPILGFDLGGRHYVVMPEEVHLERTTRIRDLERRIAEYAGSAATSLRPSLGGDGVRQILGTDTPMDGEGEMCGAGASGQQPVLRRVPRQSGGSSGKGNLSGGRVRGGRGVPGEVRVPKTRHIQAGTDGGLGRNFRARAPEDTARDRTDPK